MTEQANAQNEIEVPTFLRKNWLVTKEKTGFIGRYDMLGQPINVGDIIIDTKTPKGGIGRLLNIVIGVSKASIRCHSIIIGMPEKISLSKDVHNLKVVMFDHSIIPRGRHTPILATRDGQNRIIDPENLMACGIDDATNIRTFSVPEFLEYVSSSLLSNINEILHTSKVDLIHKHNYLIDLPLQHLDTSTKNLYFYVRKDVNIAERFFFSGVREHIYNTHSINFIEDMLIGPIYSRNLIKNENALRVTDTIQNVAKRYTPNNNVNPLQLIVQNL